MNRTMSRWARYAALLLAVSAIAACDVLPRSGPNKREIFAGSLTILANCQKFEK